LASLGMGGLKELQNLAIGKELGEHRIVRVP
jgi:hypothetical protein